MEKLGVATVDEVEEDVLNAGAGDTEERFDGEDTDADVGEADVPTVAVVELSIDGRELRDGEVPIVAEVVAAIEGVTGEKLVPEGSAEANLLGAGLGDREEPSEGVTDEEIVAVGIKDDDTLEDGPWKGVTGEERGVVGIKDREGLEDEP